MKKTLKILFIIFNIFLILGLCFLVAFSFYLIQLNSSLKFDKNKLELSNIKLDIYNEANEIINENESAKIDLKELNDYTVAAFLSIEDKDFYKHNGVNLKRIAGALFNNIKTKSLSQGASTISQQLIKNTHLTNEKTFSRKIKEILLTRKMENTLSKDKILETYLNVIYFGESAFGIEQASNVFFNKNAKDLTISESATLAGIIKSPAKYSPVYNYENCLDRRNLVLKEMLEDYYITEDEYNNAINSDINLNINVEAKSNYNNLYIKQTYAEAVEILNISEKEIGLNGIKIYTYQNPNKQKILDDIIKNDDYYLKNNYGNIADSLAVIINNKTGGIEAYAGRSEYDLVNLVRQPGSAIKPPLVYSPALEYGYISPITPILDEKIEFDGYSPNNLGNVFHGYVSATKAVAESLNIPAVKLTNYVGIEKCKNFAKKLNINFNENDNGYAIALGGFTDGIRLIDLTNSYLPYSNDGKIKDAKFIKKIVSNTGEVLYENKENERQVMGDDTAYLMHDMLCNGVKEGTSRALKNLPYMVAGKTGTVCVKGSNNNTDAISVAYTSSDTMGVWFGNTSYKKEFELSSKNNGGTYATYVIRDAFREIYKNNQPSDITKPDSVIEVDIDINELNKNHKVLIANENCPDRYKMKTLVSVNHIPETSNDNYSNFNIENFDCVLKDNKVYITFETLDYIKYEIVRVVNNNERVLQTITNNDGLYEFVDDGVMNNCTYNYYIKAENLSLHSTKQTEKICIITPKYNENYVNMLKKQNENIKTNDNKNNNWYYISNY